MANEYIISEQSLTALAEGVRVVTGEKSSLDVDEMTELLNEYEAPVGGAVETCTVTISSSAAPTKVCYISAIGDAVVWTVDEPGASPEPFEAVKGSIIYVNTTQYITISGLTELTPQAYMINMDADAVNVY